MNASSRNGGWPHKLIDVPAAETRGTRNVSGGGEIQGRCKSSKQVTASTEVIRRLLFGRFLERHW